MSEPTSFFRELRERRVVRVAVVYAAVAWAVFEGAGSLTQAFDLPAVTPRLVFSLLVLGFPVALVLAWAFQVTPEGVRRAEPFEGPGATSRLPFFGGVALGVLAVSGLALVFVRGGDDAGDMPLDEGVVIVMPLRVSAPGELSYLGGGIMDLLASRLDGDVGPRSVDAGAVAAAAGRGDGDDADAIARRFGAGRSITGSVVGNAERVVVTAEMTSLEGGRERVTASAEGAPTDLARLVDELVAELLSLDAGEYPESVGQLTSTSPAALEAYLLGRQAWRQGRYHEAVDDFDRALSLDSTFALAAIARADGGNMATGRGTGGGLEIAFRHRDRLGPRDRLYLDARRPAGPRTLSEALDAYERLTRELPDRLEAWYWLGETRIHWRNDPEPDWARRARVPFQRVLELDPSYFPALQHLLFLETYDGSPDTLRATAMRYRELAPTFHLFRGLESPEMVLVMDTVELAAARDPNDIAHAPIGPMWLIDYAPENFAPIVDAAVRAFHRRIGTDPFLTLPRALEVEYRARAAMGQRLRADSVLGELLRVQRGPATDRDVLRESTWEHVQTERAPAAASTLERRLGGVPDAELTLGDVLDLSALEIWRFVGDTAYAGSTASARLVRAAEGAIHPSDLAMEGHARLLEGWTLARSGEVDGARTALDRFDEIVRIGPHASLYSERGILLAAATVFEEIGEPARAVDFLDRRTFAASNWNPYETEFIRRLAVASAAAGDTARAIREYERYLKLTQWADAPVQPEVRAARAALERLRGR